MLQFRVMMVHSSLFKLVGWGLLTGIFYHYYQNSWFAEKKGRYMKNILVVGGAGYIGSYINE